MDKIIIDKNKKVENSGFGSLKGMRPFTKEDELNSCLDKFIIVNKKLKIKTRTF